MILIIGYGNSLRGDDGLGWYAANSLAQTLASQAPAVQVLALQQLTPELALPISQADFVVFIDACWSTEVCKKEQALVFQAIKPDQGANYSLTHHLKPSTLLAYSQLLYDTFPSAVLFSIASQHFGYGEALSAQTAALLPALLEAVTKLLVQRKNENDENY